MRLSADMYVARRAVTFLRSRGHDVVRLSELVPPTATDEALVATAVRDRRAIPTQDLDFSAIVRL